MYVIDVIVVCVHSCLSLLSVYHSEPKRVFLQSAVTTIDFSRNIRGRVLNFAIESTYVLIV